MTTDKRFKRAHRDITTAFLSLLRTLPYEKITVNNILEESDYSKTAFYAHYKNKDDCMKAIVDDEINHYIECFYKMYETKTEHAPLKTFQVYQTYFEHVKERENFYRLILSEESLNQFYTYFTFQLREKTIQTFHINSDNDLTQLFVFTKINFLFSALEFWFNNDFQFTPSELAKLCIDIDNIEKTNISLK